MGVFLSGGIPLLGVNIQTKKLVSALLCGNSSLDMNAKSSKCEPPDRQDRLLWPLEASKG
jgi:hypothetical protein